MRLTVWASLLVVVTAACGYFIGRVSRAPVPSPASEYELTGSIQEIMEGIVEPNADLIFESFATISSAAGVEERRPRTDEEWAKVEHAALSLAEAANLLRIPGRAVAGPGPHEPESPAVPELTPEQIHERIEGDRAQWTRHTTALITQARRAIDLVRKRDVEGMLQMGGDLDEVCEQCHLVYWYPNAPQGPSAP